MVDDVALNEAATIDLAVHRYRDLDVEILRSIVTQELGVFEAFVAALLQRGTR